ncbi:MAG: alcohol dehydrogenase catalytic domain-containing protein, partial [Alphaproteobacteria bacterium]|nr:alcohol dehydrogenase catalytic domain-containing protein [Alphaproteobacteria bacterium]
MKVMVARLRGNSVQLELEDAPEPAVGPTDLLIAVRAVALNRVDLLGTPYRFGHSPADAGPAAGIEMAGEIVEMGEEVVGFRLNERVAAMAVASMAQLVKVDYRLAMRLPHELPWEAAAALPVGHLTAHDALTSNGAMQPGASILVRGAGSGVGVAAMQIARLKGAGLVIG